MKRDHAGDHRDVEPTSPNEGAQQQPPAGEREPGRITGASAGNEPLAPTPPRAERPRAEHTRLRPMATDDPRRLGRGNSVVVFVAPRPTGDAPRDGRAGHDPASSEQG
jgi:hypothetical protein